MMCSNPFLRSANFGPLDIINNGIESAVPYPCGKCLNCRINQARIWTHRIMLELACHKSALFVTLTYSDENLPPDQLLRKAHVRNYIKRLRKALAPVHLRYFGCGEYGDDNLRPHYHIAIFGPGIMDQEVVKREWYTKIGEIRVVGKKIRRLKHGYRKEPTGFVHIGEVNKNSARYITGYVLKKNLGRRDYNFQTRQWGSPEFMVCSRRPGIGGDNIDKIKEDLEKNKYYDPRVHRDLKYGKDNRQPLGRYLFERLNFDRKLDDQIDKEVQKRQTEQVYKALGEGRTKYYEKLMEEKAQARKIKLKQFKMKRKERRL